MNNTIDQQFIEFVVKSLVSKPDAVQVERRIDEKGVLLELTVDPEDLGRVIGKRGATAQSLRTLLRALGTKNDARYNLKIVDNGAPRGDRAPREDRDQTVSEAPVADAPADDASPPADYTSDQPDEPVATTAPAGDDDEDDDIFNSLRSQEQDHSDVVSKTRKELEELDDLDV